MLEQLLRASFAASSASSLFPLDCSRSMRRDASEYARRIRERSPRANGRSASRRECRTSAVSLRLSRVATSSFNVQCYETARLPHFAIEQTILSSQKGIINVAFRIRIASHRSRDRDIEVTWFVTFDWTVVRDRFGERRGIRRGLREPSGVPREDLESLNFPGILEDRQRSPKISREFANIVKKLGEHLRYLAEVKGNFARRDSQISKEEMASCSAKRMGEVANF